LVVGAADSALAAKKKADVAGAARYAKCEQEAIKLGTPPGQSGHREYMMQCLYGVVTGRPAAQ
jgi:hypothetical protein